MKLILSTIQISLIKNYPTIRSDKIPVPILSFCRYCLEEFLNQWGFLSDQYFKLWLTEPFKSNLHSSVKKVQKKTIIFNILLHNFKFTIKVIFHKLLYYFYSIRMIFMQLQDSANRTIIYSFILSYFSSRCITILLKMK